MFWEHRRKWKYSMEFMKNRNGTIEFYRLMVTMIIAIFHLNVQYLGIENVIWLKGGYLGTEFFFILSGYLLAKKISGRRQINVPYKEAGRIVKKKIMGLYPIYIISMLMYFILYIGIHNITNIKQAILWCMEEIWAFIFLNAIGIPDTQVFVGSIWFLSSLILNTYIVSFLLLRDKDKFVGFIAPIFCIVFYGCCGKMYHSLSIQEEWVGPLYGALGRGFADLSVGVIAHEIFVDIDVTDKMKKLLSVLEIVILIYILKILNTGFSVDDFKIVVLFAIIIAFAEKRITYVDLLLDKRFFAYLGKYGYDIYLNHLIFSTLLTLYVRDIPYYVVLIAYIILIIFGVLFMEIMKKIFIKIVNYLNNYN